MYRMCMCMCVRELVRVGPVGRSELSAFQGKTTPTMENRGDKTKQKLKYQANIMSLVVLFFDGAGWRFCRPFRVGWKWCVEVEWVPFVSRSRPLLPPLRTNQPPRSDRPNRGRYDREARTYNCLWLITSFSST